LSYSSHSTAALLTLGRKSKHGCAEQKVTRSWKRERERERETKRRDRDLKG
jgi:hypothetical protein